MGDWDGWLTLKRDEIWPEARANTARVIVDVNAHAQCIVEADSQPLLQRFNSQEIPKAKRFEFNMLIDGNDDRRIDVGILSRLPIRELRGHIADKDNAGEVFSRDCLEVRLELPGGGPLWMLLNHFKSKGYSGPSQGRRSRPQCLQTIAASWISSAQYGQLFKQQLEALAQPSKCLTVPPGHPSAGDELL